MNWISVTKELPKENIQVLVAPSLPEGMVKRVALAYWSMELDDWEIDRDDRLSGIYPETIRYWMPIPNPPEDNYVSSKA
jgi:hypothetical protein